MIDLMSNYEQWCNKTVEQHAKRLIDDRWDSNASEISEAEGYDQLEEIFKRHEAWVAKEVRLMTDRMKSVSAKLRYIFSELKDSRVSKEDVRYVYLMRSSQLDRVKIGISRSPEDRLKQVQTGCPENVELLAIASSPLANQIESALHRVFKKKRTSGEWFCLDATEISQVISFLSDISQLEAINET